MTRPADPYFHGPLARWLRALSKVPPDPWDAQVSAEVQSDAAVPLCLNCLFPQGPHSWFCPHCGHPTGDFVALMPYLQVFVAGEALRRGVTGPPERRFGVQVFLSLYALSQFAAFAPFYWYWMWRRSSGRPIGPEPQFEFARLDETPGSWRP